MKKAFLMIAAALFIFAGCQKEDLKKESKTSNVIHINVEQMAPATRVAANDIAASPLTFKWEEGDQVGFLDTKQGTSTTFNCTNPATGEFVKTEGPDLDPAVTYMVAYPASYLSNLLGTHEEHYRPNQIPREHIILAQNVSGNAKDFSLNIHSTMIHFQLKGTATIGSIEYYTYNGSKATNLICTNGVQLSENGIDFYIDVPSTSSQGFSLIFKDTEGKQIGNKESTFNLSDNDVTCTMVDFPAISVSVE